MKKITLALTISLSLSASAQNVMYQELSTFNDKTAMVKIGNGYDWCTGHNEVEELLNKAKTREDQKPHVQRLVECGDSWLLPTLSTWAEEDGNLVSAYAYMYAVDKIAKASRRYHPDDAEVRGPIHAQFVKDLNRLGKELSAEDRKAAVRQAWELILSQPYGWMGM